MDRKKLYRLTYMCSSLFADYLSSMRIASAMVLFIYSFHMPMLFLVSGLCLKYDDKHKFRVDKVIYFLLIGFAMKAAIYFMEKLLEENRNGIGSVKIISRGICLLLPVYLVYVI